jgi:ABC-type sugar transport system ATPase subunit
LIDRLGLPLPPARQMEHLTVVEMQTVEIAKALAHDAAVIIMDEPTSAISAREIEALFAIIRDLRDRGVGIIYTSHKLDEVFRIADTVTVLRTHIAAMNRRGFRIPHSAFRTPPKSCLGTAPAWFMGSTHLLCRRVGRFRLFKL